MKTGRGLLAVNSWPTDVCSFSLFSSENAGFRCALIIGSCVVETNEWAHRYLPLVVIAGVARDPVCWKCMERAVGEHKAAGRLVEVIAMDVVS